MLILGVKKKPKQTKHKQKIPPPQKNPNPAYTEVIFTLETDLHFKMPLQFRSQFKKSGGEVNLKRTLNFDLCWLLLL